MIFVSLALHCVFVLYIKATQLFKLQRIEHEIRQHLELLSSIRKREIGEWGKKGSGGSTPAKSVQSNIRVLVAIGEQTSKTNGDYEKKNQIREVKTRHRNRRLLLPCPSRLRFLQLLVKRIKLCLLLWTGLEAHWGGKSHWKKPWFVQCLRSSNEKARKFVKWPCFIDIYIDTGLFKGLSCENWVSSPSNLTPWRSE